MWKPWYSCNVTDPRALDRYCHWTTTFFLICNVHKDGCPVSAWMWLNFVVTSFVWITTLCLSYHSNTERSSLHYFDRLGHHSGRLLGPKIALGVFLKDTRRVTASGVGPRFRKFWLLSRRSTNWAASPLRFVTTCLTTQR